MNKKGRFTDIPARLRSTSENFGRQIAIFDLLEDAALKIEALELEHGRIRQIFGCGQKVLVGGVIEGVIEEVIFARNMTDPLYLVEWWHEGDLRGRRFHECELEAVK